jgi:hypothetical protein
LAKHLSAYPKKQFIDPEELEVTDELDLRLSEQDFQHGTFAKEALQVGALQQSKLYSIKEARAVLSAPENVVWRKSLRSEADNFALFLLSCLLINIFAYSYPETIGYVQIADIFGGQVGVVIPYLSIFPLFFLFRIIYRVFNTRYVFGLKSMLCITGFFSTSLTCTELYYTNIGVIDIESSWFEKLLGLGNLKIHALQAGSEDIIVEGIFAPQQCKAMIERRMQMHAKRKAGTEMLLFGDEN